MGLTNMSNAGITILLPFLLAYVGLSMAVSLICTLLVFPAVIIARRFYWALPFATLAFKSEHPRLKALAKWTFELCLSLNTITRLLTIPLRPLPDFYIVGFPKCGTTTLANHLKRHPALGSVIGPPLKDTLTKESHFFSGVLGRNTTNSPTLYRSFFPSVLCRWWAEVVRGVHQYMCFDACPTNACLPYMAERIHGMTPNAKLIFLIRDPASALFSGEIMMRNWGVDLPWSLMDEMKPDDGRFAEHEDEVKLWKELQQLGPDDPLPENMPRLVCSRLGMALRFGKVGDRMVPFLKRFPRNNIMVIDFNDLVSNTEGTLKDVFEFVGVDPSRYTHTPLKPGMQSEYKGRRVHPSVRQWLVNDFYKGSNQRLQSVLERRFSWIPEDP